MLFCLIVLLSLTLELLFSRRSEGSCRRVLKQRIVAIVPQRFTRLAVALLILTFAIELVIVAIAAHADSAREVWLNTLPISLTFPGMRIPQIYRIGFGAVSLVESLLLAAFLISTYARTWRLVDTRTTAVGAVAITILAVLSPAMTSGDLYAYIGDALLGPAAAYSPPATSLPGEYALIHQIWKLPLLPAAYGPLWLWWNSAIVGLITGLHAKIILLRIVNVAALATILYAMRLLKVEPRLIAATALNPAIAFYYLTNGHNDLVAIAVVLLAMTFATRAPFAAGILAGVGASIKLTLIVPAVAGAIVIANFKHRFIYIALITATAAIIAVALGGHRYLHALLVVAGEYSLTNKFLRVRVAHGLLAAVTLVLTVLAVTACRICKSNAFGFASLAEALYPWYLIWGLPYAVTRSEVLTTLLIGFPIATAVLENEINSYVLGPLVALILLFAVVAMLQRRFSIKRTQKMV